MYNLLNIKIEKGQEIKGPKIYKMIIGGYSKLENTLK